jgi:Ca2+-binding RTX toxin-like protein
LTNEITVLGRAYDFDSRLLFPQTLGQTFSDSSLHDYDKATQTYGSGDVTYHENGVEYHIKVWGHLTGGTGNDISGGIDDFELQKVVKGKLVTIGQMFIGSDTTGEVYVPVQSLAALTPDILFKQTETFGFARLDLMSFGGDDKLYGSTSENSFDGGEGNDVFTGYAGKDRFIFALTGKDNADHITDFTHARDQIVIELEAGGPFGDISHDSHLKQIFHDITNSAEDKNDRIIYDRDTGILSFDDDGSSKDKAVIFAHIDNHAKLDFHDFVIWG